ncbi:hypothetical protein CR161_00145 [Prosthecochloris sp. ZM]|uniref:hypothetical protein n=1 Tax=unclassified Prosthecochloris TaxID=2632826 RepID=UPI000DF74D71|nr:MULTISPECIES: hypothetical protein [unclassified Prosthecochloris]NEX11348.1 hypothetical protein [Prosthecochloris sp.]RDD29243.1 hypothetical protein CR161_00145 [Prosthecochloris sp. ZM]
MTANEIKERLIELVAEVNVGKLPKTGELAFHQQRVTTGNLSVYLTKGIGRIYVQPNSSACDVSLSGKVIEVEMYPFMRELFGDECDGFKQTNRNKGWLKQPFWRTADFGKVRECIRYYARNYSCQE